MPNDYSYYKNKNYEDVVQELKSLGFTYISTRADDDLIVGFLHDDGNIKSIAINGNEKFVAGDRFSPGSEITIVYHSFPDDKSKTSSVKDKETTDEIEIDFDYSQFIHCDYTDAYNKIKELGFTNIVCEIAPVNNSFSENEVEFISIDGKRFFTSGDVFPNSTNVKILYHSDKMSSGVVDSEEDITDNETDLNTTSNSQSETDKEKELDSEAETDTEKESDSEAETDTENESDIQTETDYDQNHRHIDKNNIPINIVEGYDLLQSFYAQCTEKYSIDELRELALNCCLYCYQYNGGAGFIDLQISPREYTKTIYSSHQYEFDCDSIWVTYDTIHGRAELHDVNYEFVDTLYSVKYNAEQHYYITMHGMYAIDPTKRIYDPFTALNDGKNAVKNEW